MTIKKRLFISNILMLVIPAVLAIIVLISCLFIFLVSMFPHAEDRLGFHEELTETRYRAVELVADWLSDSNGNRKTDGADGRRLRGKPAQRRAADGSGDSPDKRRKR